VGTRPFGLYVHVPFCTVRCGYCDFNTYTAEELGDAPGASRWTYAGAAIAEIRQARRVLGDRDVPVSTVFLGGGTPTLLKAIDLGAILAAIAAEFGLEHGAEITTESNPDSVALWDLEELRSVGFNRISFGMQSAVPSVLATLDRTHDPLRVPAVVEWARAAGFEQVSLDLIYGTPGETMADWEASLDAALACEPDHLSAYSLIVEDGTALARRVRSGELPMPDDDDLADKYELADERLESAGLSWYEVSNWATDEASRCRHNLLYWTGGDWWHAMVERQAPGGVRRPAPRRPEPGAGTGGARPRDAARRAVVARAPAERGPGPRHARRRRPEGGAGPGPAGAARADRSCGRTWPAGGAHPHRPAARRRRAPRPAALTGQGQETIRIVSGYR
jgi:oxygen-independent coproporphyrinogen-3 oxidase